MIENKIAQILIYFSLEKTTHVCIYNNRAQNLKHSIVMKPRFRNLVLLKGSGSFVDTNSFVKKYYLMYFL